MIYLEIAGRSGNQLFRYSFARKIQYYTQKKLYIDFHRVYEKKGQYWENSLKRFQISNYEEVDNKKFLYKNMSILQFLIYIFYKSGNVILKKNRKLLKRYQLFMQPLLNRLGICFLELGFFNYNIDKLKKNKLIYICGCFESEKYFNDIRDQLLQEFRPKKSLKQENEKMYKKMKNTNSVCISIRRGDFLNLDFYNICDKNYYDKAIQYCKNNLDNPTFFIFSDDIEWCKENFKINNSEVFFETGNDDVAEKLTIMSTCKHFIISNSTFSWWAQYLGTYENKVVISPTRWYKSDDIDSELINKDKWILI